MGDPVKSGVEIASEMSDFSEIWPEFPTKIWMVVGQGLFNSFIRIYWLINSYFDIIIMIQSYIKKSWVVRKTNIIVFFSSSQEISDLIYSFINRVKKKKNILSW